MDTPPEPQVLADTGGLVVTDDGRRVNIFDRRTGGLAVTAFVLGALTLVVGGFGIVALVTGTPSMGVGAAFLAAGVVLAVLLVVVVRKFRSASQPTAAHVPVGRGARP